MELQLGFKFQNLELSCKERQKLTFMLLCKNPTLKKEEMKP